jgi:hypothetical protein
MVNSQQTRSINQQSTMAATDYYKHLTEELNKCFDDIELFVRYLEALTEYTKELERDHRRKDKKSGSLFHKKFVYSILKSLFLFSWFKTND